MIKQIIKLNELSSRKIIFSLIINKIRKKKSFKIKEQKQFLISKINKRVILSTIDISFINIETE